MPMKERSSKCYWEKQQPKYLFERKTIQAVNDRVQEYVFLNIKQKNVKQNGLSTMFTCMFVCARM